MSLSAKSVEGTLKALSRWERRNPSPAEPAGAKIYKKFFLLLA
jgi:hypothetical protein